MFLVVLMLTTAGMTWCASGANDGIEPPPICDSRRVGIEMAKIKAPTAPPTMLNIASCHGRTRNSLLIQTLLYELTVNAILLRSVAETQ